MHRSGIDLSRCSGFLPPNLFNLVDFYEQQSKIKIDLKMQEKINASVRV